MAGVVLLDVLGFVAGEAGFQIEQPAGGARIGGGGGVGAAARIGGVAGFGLGVGDGADHAVGLAAAIDAADGFGVERDFDAEIGAAFADGAAQTFEGEIRGRPRNRTR